LGAIAVARGTIPRSVLLMTGLGALAAGIAFVMQANLDINLIALVGSSTCSAPIQQSSESNLLFTIGLAVASIISLGWLLRPFTVIDRVTLLVLFGVATI